MEGQIGLEPTPAEYLAKMVEVFREVKRCLRDDGTLWCNLGDGYAGGGGYSPGSPSNQNGGSMSARQDAGSGSKPQGKAVPSGLKPKDLIGMPWRLAFALQADGWYLRSDIIWSKPNPMPESVTDRPTKSHEYIFLLSKQPRYYFDNEAIKEESIDRESIEGRRDTGYCSQYANTLPERAGTRAGFGKIEPGTTYPTRNIRTVWTIATQAYPEAHFATYPEKLIEPCVLAGTSAKGCCPECGKGWVREVERTRYEPEIVAPGVRFVDESRADKTRKLSGKEYNEQASCRTVGWSPGCKCGKDPIPATVLDPFTGSGTTAVVALRHGRRFVGCELSAEYVRLAEKRIGQSTNPATHRTDEIGDAPLFAPPPEMP